MSVSYALDFGSLLLIGPHETMIVAAASAWSQCHLNRKQQKNPLYRTFFSMATLIVTVEATGWAFAVLQAPDADPLTAVALPLVGAAFTYFLVNTGLVATAVALASQEKNIAVTWHKNFLWSAPSYFVGRGLCGGVGVGRPALRFLGGAAHVRADFSDVSHLQRSNMGRLEAQQNAQVNSDLHLADHRSSGRGDRRQRSDDERAHPARAVLRSRARQGHRPVGGGDSGG